MGFYLDCHRDFDKAEMLILALDAKEVSEPDRELWQAIPQDYCAVCVVEYDTHDAAGIVFDERELNHTKRSVGGGQRPCRWLLIRKDLAALNCPAYADWLAKGPPPSLQREK